MTKNQLRVLWEALQARNLITGAWHGMRPPWIKEDGLDVPDFVWADFVYAVSAAEQAPEE